MQGLPGELYLVCVESVLRNSWRDGITTEKTFYCGFFSDQAQRYIEFCEGQNLQGEFSHLNSDEVGANERINHFQRRDRIRGLIAIYGGLNLERFFEKCEADGDSMPGFITQITAEKVNPEGDIYRNLEAYCRSHDGFSNAVFDHVTTRVKSRYHSQPLSTWTRDN